MALGDITRIRTNVSALGALNALKANNARNQNAALRLATGKQINSAADDPSGFSLSSTLLQQARAFGNAVDNVSDAGNVLDTAESGLGQINDILGQIADKTLQAASDTQGPNERAAIQNEVNQLGQEIDSIVNTTQFNGTSLLQGATLTFQVGPSGSDTATFALSSSFTSSALGVNGLALGTQALASASLGSVNSALNVVQGALQNIGALSDRLQVKSHDLSQFQLNAAASASRIQDADMATTQLEKSSSDILNQIAMAQLAAANSSPSMLARLF
ncbi:MAG: hypothetical protein HY294_10175 [Candidatus Rokubacteria bacterium]|nr:hypothetical protein [Candidatus Rokubacteria bacterium]MBI3826351.1 hypothetical protein [Candidatus Rokubacteria bacterium]